MAHWGAGMGRAAQRLAQAMSACPPVSCSSKTSSTTGRAVRNSFLQGMRQAEKLTSSVFGLPLNASKASMNMRPTAGFAASAAWPPPPCAGPSVTQTCGITTSSAAEAPEEGDGTEGVPSSRQKANIPSAEGSNDDDLPVIRGGDSPINELESDDISPHELSLLNLAVEDPSDAEAQKRRAQMRNYVAMEGKDPLELLLFAKQHFMQKDTNVIPIPRHVREAMYRHKWDKALVDVRRSVQRQRGLSTKKETYTAMVAIGNFQGLFGLGTASAETSQLAVAQAYLTSYGQLKYVPLYRGHTIYHQIDYSFHEMKMRLMPRRDGWGVKANDLLTSLCGIIGIKNISIATFGRRSNKFYLAQCFQEALQTQSAAHEGVEASGMYLRELLSSNTPPYRGDGTSTTSAIAP